MVVGASVRASLKVAALLALYFLGPLAPRLDAPNLILLLAALVGVAVLVVAQVRSVIESPVPSIRAVEALAATVTLLVLVFAAAYFLISESQPAAFTEPLTRADALYFAMTVFSTVGFGDITAVTESARLLVVGQIAVDLAVLGAGVRVFVAAARIGRQRAADVAPARSPDAGDDRRPPVPETHPNRPGRDP